jgi:hypothetical protein
MNRTCTGTSPKVTQSGTGVITSDYAARHRVVTEADAAGWGSLAD